MSKDSAGEILQQETLFSSENIIWRCVVGVAASSFVAITGSPLANLQLNLTFFCYSLEEEQSCKTGQCGEQLSWCWVKHFLWYGNFLHVESEGWSLRGRQKFWGKTCKLTLMIRCYKKKWSLPHTLIYFAQSNTSHISSHDVKRWDLARLL